MNHDNLDLRDALPTMSPPAIAAALRSGTAIIPAHTSLEGDERLVVVADRDGRRMLLVFSTRAALAAWTTEASHDGRYRVVLGADIADVAREQQVARVVLDPAGVGLGVAPADLRAALDQAETDGVPAMSPGVSPAPAPSLSLADGVLGADPLIPGFDNPELTSAMRERDRMAAAAALRTGTVILSDAVLADGGHRVDVFTEDDGRMQLCAFSTGSFFENWVQRTGHEGGYRVVGGAGLAALLKITGVDAVVMDMGSEHVATLDAPSLAPHLI